MKSKKSLVCTILSISLLTVMAGAAVAPALGAIKDHFSGCSPMTIQLIVSIPALFIILTNFCFRSLCRVMNTKAIALTGLTLYLLAGAGVALVDNIVLLLVMRALLGVGVGLIMPLSTGLLTYYFPPEEQSRLMGMAAAMNQLGGVVATLLAGILAAIQWNYAFLVYLLALIAIALVLAFLPKERLVERRKGASSRRARMVERRKFMRSLTRFHPSVTAMLFIMILFFIYPTNFALTARQAGVDTFPTTIIMCGLDVVATVIGLCFAVLMRRFSRGMKYVAPLCFLAGYLIMACFPGLGGMILGSAVIGVGSGAGVPYVNTIAGIKGGKDAATTVMPLISAALYLGQFLSPLIVEPLASAVGGPTAPYFVAAGIAILFLLQTILTRRHHALPPRR